MVGLKYQLIVVFANFCLDVTKIVSKEPTIAEKRSKIRTFFEKVAVHFRIDPLVASNWYTISPDAVRQLKVPLCLNAYCDTCDFRVQMF